MDHATTTEIIVGSFGAGFVFLILLVGFFGTRYVKSTDNLAEAIQDLTRTMATMDKAQALQESRITNHGEEIKDLWSSICNNPDCPNWQDRRQGVRRAS